MAMARATARWTWSMSKSELEPRAALKAARRGGDGGGLEHAVLVEDEGVGGGDDVSAGTVADVAVVLEVGEEGER